MEKTRDHFLHLAFVGTPGTSDRLLDLVRRIFRN
jgi:hypothetical protein